MVSREIAGTDGVHPSGEFPGKCGCFISDGPKEAHEITAQNRRSEASHGGVAIAELTIPLRRMDSSARQRLVSALVEALVADYLADQREFAATSDDSRPGDAREVLAP